MSGTLLTPTGPRTNNRSGVNIVHKATTLIVLFVLTLTGCASQVKTVKSAPSATSICTKYSANVDAVTRQVRTYGALSAVTLVTVAGSSEIADWNDNGTIWQRLDQALYGPVAQCYPQDVWDSLNALSLEHQ